MNNMYTYLSEMYNTFRKNGITKKSGGGGGVSKPKEPSPPKFDFVNIPDSTTNKTKKNCSNTEKKCGFCKQSGHNVARCTTLTEEFEKITNYCSVYEHQVNLTDTRKFLETIDKDILRRYVAKYNIANYMHKHCLEYYENNVNSRDNKKNNIELIIGYLCVLPLHPEIKREKPKPQPQPKSKPNRHKDNGLGLDFGRSAIVYTKDGPELAYIPPKFKF